MRVTRQRYLDGRRYDPKQFTKPFNVFDLRMSNDCAAQNPKSNANCSLMQLSNCANRLIETDVCCLSGCVRSVLNFNSFRSFWLKRMHNQPKIYSHSIFGCQIVDRNQCISIDDRFVRPKLWDPNVTTITLNTLYALFSSWLQTFFFFAVARRFDILLLFRFFFFYSVSFFRVLCCRSFSIAKFFVSLLFVVELVSLTRTRRDHKQKKLFYNWWRQNNWTNYLSFFLVHLMCDASKSKKNT